MDYVGKARYFMTFCTRNRRPAFLDATVAEGTLLQFRRSAAAERFAILAYCVMPDHVHLLVEGLSKRSDLQRFAKMAKQRSGGVYSRRFRLRLWQDGYFERVLRDADDAAQIARYILMNPVRAGLVKTPSDYPYLGSDVWETSRLVG